jgi:transcriptional antiterminator
LFKTEHKGIEIIGNEIAHRNAIARFFDSYVIGKQIEQVVPIKQSRLQEKTMKNLIDVYPEDHVMKVARIIAEAEEKYDFFLMEDYFVSLLTHIVISLSRIISGNPVEVEFLPPDEEYPQLEIDTANYIANRIERIFNIRISQSEKDYICIHLVGYNAFSIENSSHPEIPQKIEILAISMIESVDAIVGGSYIRDKLLFFGLCFHLISTVYRLEKGLYHNSPQKTDFPQNGIIIYDAVKESAELYERICDVKADDDEILHITYYFLLSKHRNMRKLRALLVCNQGIVARMELHKLIEISILHIDVVDNCSAYQLQFQPEREYDFIITTENLEKREKPMIDISRLAKNDYIKCIEEFLSSKFG